MAKRLLEGKFYDLEEEEGEEEDPLSKPVNPFDPGKSIHAKNREEIHETHCRTLSKKKA